MARKRLNLDKLEVPTLSLTWKPGVQTLEAIENEVIAETIKHLQFNRSLTANVLGISVRTLRTKLAKLRFAGIKVDR